MCTNSGVELCMSPVRACAAFIIAPLADGYKVVFVDNEDFLKELE